jgi:hypothetical protein
MATVCAVAGLAVPFLAAQSPHADMILRGGKVITVDSQDRAAEAVAVVGNRITAIGSNHDVAALIGPQTKVIELNGRTLLPGFIDAHSHVQGLAESEHAWCRSRHLRSKTRRRSSPN